MNRSTPDLPVHHQVPEFTQTHVTVNIYGPLVPQTLQTFSSTCLSSCVLLNWVIVMQGSQAFKLQSPLSLGSSPSPHSRVWPFSPPPVLTPRPVQAFPVISRQNQWSCSHLSNLEVLIWNGHLALIFPYLKFSSGFPPCRIQSEAVKSLCPQLHLSGHSPRRKTPAGLI